MDYEDLILGFTSIIYEALPFIVLGVVIAGLLEEFVPQQAIAKIIPRNRLLAIGLGGLLGLVFPMCECGIIVVMKRLLRKGLPLSVCVCYMLSGPIINFVVMGSTYVAFTNNSIYEGPVNVVLLRIGLAYLVAINAALIVEWQFRKHGHALLATGVTRGLPKLHAREDREESAGSNENESNETEANGTRTWMQRLGAITETALHDFVDIMAFLVLGACLAVAGRALLAETRFEEDIQRAPALGILVMMGTAVIFCLCSEADAFVAANFSTIWPAASKIGFLVLGPMLDIKLYLMYTRVFRPRLILTIILAVVSQIFVYCLALHYLVELSR